jgi:hypothetical protein
MRSMEGFPGFCAVFLGSIHPRESSDHKRERERERGRQPFLDQDFLKFIYWVISSGKWF